MAKDTDGSKVGARALKSCGRGRDEIGLSKIAIGA